jgi:hypothetical protein
VNFLHVVESAIGTAAALVVVLGGRQLASFLSYRALRAALKLQGRLK